MFEAVIGIILIMLAFAGIVGLYIGIVYLIYLGYMYIVPVWHLPAIDFPPFLVTWILLATVAGLFKSHNTGAKKDAS